MAYRAQAAKLKLRKGEYSVVNCAYCEAEFVGYGISQHDLWLFHVESERHKKAVLEKDGPKEEEGWT